MRLRSRSSLHRGGHRRRYRYRTAHRAYRGTARRYRHRPVGGTRARGSSRGTARRYRPPTGERYARPRCRHRARQPARARGHTAVRDGGPRLPSLHTQVRTRARSGIRAPAIRPTQLPPGGRSPTGKRRTPPHIDASRPDRVRSVRVGLTVQPRGRVLLGAGHSGAPGTCGDPTNDAASAIGWMRCHYWADRAAVLGDGPWPVPAALLGATVPGRCRARADARSCS